MLKGTTIEVAPNSENKRRGVLSQWPILLYNNVRPLVAHTT